MEKELDPTSSNKKPYAPPEQVRHGNVDEITQKGGSSFTDVPLGDTPDASS